MNDFARENVLYVQQTHEPFDARKDNLYQYSIVKKNNFYRVLFKVKT